jgi:transcriptional regulator with XRE-family HTH domain
MKRHIFAGNWRQRIDMISNIDIAQDLRRMRGTRTLAEMSSLTGFSVSYLSDIERGRTVPTLKTIQQIATAAGYMVMIQFYEPIKPTE